MLIEDVLSKEANEDLRFSFLSDELIQKLWQTVFIVEKPNIMINRMRCIRGEASALSEVKFHEFYNSLVYM